VKKILKIHIAESKKQLSAEPIAYQIVSSTKARFGTCMMDASITDATETNTHHLAFEHNPLWIKKFMR
jgi:hypothetical protein